MRIVIALGGNALLQRGERLDACNQIANAKLATQQIADIAKQHQVILCHGNGPQVGMLAMQAQLDHHIAPYPLDILGAETQGMIGYILQQQLDNLDTGKRVSTLLTQVRVDENDPAFDEPSKPIGAVYNQYEAQQLNQRYGWTVAVDGQDFRRVVPSPLPKEIIERDTIEQLLDSNHLVICAGGGGIPVIRKSNNKLQGVEAVIDKDRTAALLAEQLHADRLMILTDIDAVYLNYGSAHQRAIRYTNVYTLEQQNFSAGSMGPKVAAACQFVNATGKQAHIGKLDQAMKMLENTSGTILTQ